MQDRRHKQPLGVEADEPGQRHRPLLDDQFGGDRSVLGVWSGKQIRPGGLDHGPRHVEAGSKAGEAIGSRKGLDAQGRDAQITRRRLEHVERFVTEVPPDGNRFGPAPFGCVTIVGTTLQPTGLFPEISQRGADAAARLVSLQVDAGGIVAGERLAEAVWIEVEREWHGGTRTGGLRRSGRI